MKMGTLRMSKRNVAIAVVVLILAGGLLFFFESSHKERLILATTTSTYDSGLLDILVPAFEREHLLQVEVQIVSVGTGKALAMGRSGDCDVLLVHARQDEDQFVAEGHGVLRSCVMYNDFVIVGPMTDPVSIRLETNAVDAFKRIATEGENGEAIFVSRGDNSGTNKKELTIWSSAGIDPTGRPWYKEVGTGMGNTLTITSEMQAYTLADRGTWISKRDTLNSEILNEGDGILLNPYGIMAINPEKHPHVNFKMAKAFIYFLISPEGQKIIDDFRKGGEVLFKPLFGECTDTIRCPTQEEEQEIYEQLKAEFG
jgi:tungstate transport system substrate-binding protein